MARFDEVLIKLDEAMQWIANSEDAKERFSVDGEEEEKFRRRLYEETVNRIEKDIHVDDLVTGENTLDEVRNVKRQSAELFQKGGFILHK